LLDGSNVESVRAMPNTTDDHFNTFDSLTWEFSNNSSPSRSEISLKNPAAAIIPPKMKQSSVSKPPILSSFNHK
jgi:hypothetical protein